MSENTSSTTTVKPHFKLWAKKAEANEVTPQHPHKPFPGWVYGVLFVIFDIIVVTALEVGVSSNSTRVQLSSPTVGFGFVSKMWADGNFVFMLNVILVALLYLMLLMLFNRFWTASIVILAVGIIVAAIEHFKVEIRYEAILPADLGFLGSNTGNMLTFIPAGAHVTILVALGAFAVLLALILVLRHFDGRKGRMIRTYNLSLNLTSRLILLLLPILVFALYCIHVSTTDSPANKFSRTLGDTPSMWDSLYDAQRNGPLVAFTRQLNPKIMDKPSNYSEETMKKVAARYQKEAETINTSRTNNLTDSTVVYVLSESFSDPSRVPGLKTNKDSMPNIRKILRLRRRYGQSRIYGTFRPEHGQFRFLPVQPVPAAGPEPALDPHHQPDVGRVRQLARLPPVRIQHVLACHELQEVRLLALLHVDRSGRDQVSGQDRRVAVRL